MNADFPAVSLNFRSDNVATVAPEILRALDAANRGLAAADGDDEYSALLNRKFSDLFERDVTLFPVSTGTAANALSLATCARPYGAIYCHEEAHIHTSEAGATEAFSGGAKLIALPGTNGKLEPATIEAALQQFADRIAGDCRALAAVADYARRRSRRHAFSVSSVRRSREHIAVRGNTADYSRSDELRAAGGSDGRRRRMRTLLRWCHRPHRAAGGIQYIADNVADLIETPERRDRRKDRPTARE